MLLAVGLAGCNSSDSGDAPAGDLTPVELEAGLSATIVLQDVPLAMRWSAPAASNCELVDGATVLPVAGSWPLPTDEPGRYTLAVACATPGHRVVRSLDYEVVPPPAVVDVDVWLDARQLAAGASPEALARIDDPATVVGQTRVRISLGVTRFRPEFACRIAGRPLVPDGNGRLAAEILPAYFRETLAASCALSGAETTLLTTELAARDPPMEAALADYLATQIPDAGAPAPNDPYAGYRRASYYAELYRFIQSAEIHRHPDRYGVDSESELYARIEAWLFDVPPLIDGHLDLD